MTSWYSSIVSKTTSQISSLRATLLSSDSDGDTPDDTHVCRVLRNYYTDKGRPLPPWLPPDPKAPVVAAQPVYAQPSVGSRYGGLGASVSGGALSSLWDTREEAPPSVPVGGGGGGGSAQDRLKQRLWGPGRQSPAGGGQGLPPSQGFAQRAPPPGGYGYQGGQGQSASQGQRRPGLPTGPRGYR